MPFYTQLNICLRRHGRNKTTRFDPMRSDSKFPALFCSLKCENEWIARNLASLTLADVLEIQARACHLAGMASLAVAGGHD
jgi:hypothetical protein